MEKLLFIVDSYLPSPSSNGACVRQIENAIREEYEVHILSVIHQEYPGENVHYITSERKPSTRFSRLFSCAEDTQIVDELTAKASELIDCLHIQKIVCVFRPVECLLAGLRLKKRYKDRISVNAYCLDNMGEMLSNSRLKAEVLLFNQKRFFSKINRYFDQMIALRYYRSTFERYLKRQTTIQYVGIPHVTREMYVGKMPRLGKKIITYTGSFYSAFRNPQKLAAIIEQLLETDKSIEFHFFSWGCEDVMEPLQKKFPANIYLHGKVPMDEAHQAIKASDILLNLGNDLPNQVPGKLLEYIATGKPILHFCFREDDPALEDCKLYENCLMIDENFQDFEKLIEWIHAEKILSREEIASKFADSTPEYFMRLISDCRGDAKC